MNAMRASNAKRIALLKRTLLANFCTALHPTNQNIARLRELITKRSIAKIGRGHSVVNPPAWLGCAMRDFGVDIRAHIREKCNYVMIGHRFNLIDFLTIKVRVCANPCGFFSRNANSA